MVLEQLDSHLETQISTLLLISKLIQDSSGGLVVKNLPASLGDTDLIPGLEDSTCHGATKPMSRKYWSSCTLEPVLHNERSHRIEKSMYCNQRVALACCNQRCLCSATETQCSPQPPAKAQLFIFFSPGLKIYLHILKQKIIFYLVFPLYVF